MRMPMSPPRGAVNLVSSAGRASLGLVLALFGLGTRVETATAASLDQQLVEVVSAYRTDPKLCIDRSRALLASPALDDASRREVQLLMAKAHVHAGEVLEARQVLGKLRSEDSGYELDARRHRILWPHYLAVFGAELQTRDGVRTLCVFDFENRVVGPVAAEWDGLGAVLARKLESALASRTELRLVERERIDYILREMDLCDKQSPDTRVCAGRLAGAQVMVFGEFTAFGKESEIHVRIAETETSYLLGGGEEVVRGAPERTLERIDDLADTIADVLEAHIAPAEKSSDRYEAWRNYGVGLDFLAQGDIDAAYQAFLDALEEDPEFEQAQEALRDLPEYSFAGSSATQR